MADTSRAVYVSIGTNLVVAVAKFVASAFTGSSSMLAEGIHSLVDTVNGALLLVGNRARRREPDDEHPFGYGKELYFWGFVVAMLIFALGGGISIIEGVERLLHPEPLETPAWNYAVLLVALISDGYSWIVAYSQLRASRHEPTILLAARASKDSALFIVWFEDTAALAGIGLAFLGVALSQALGNPYPDALASLLIGVTMAATALLLGYETRELLIGERADVEIVRGIRAIVEADGCITHCGPPLTMHLGPEDVLVNLDVQFRAGLSSDAIFEAVDRLESSIRERFPEVRRIFIEPERLRLPDGRPSESPRAAAGVARAGAPGCPAERGPSDY